MPDQVQDPASTVGTGRQPSDQNSSAAHASPAELRPDVSPEEHRLSAGARSGVVDSRSDPGGEEPNEKLVELRPAPSWPVTQRKLEFSIDFLGNRWSTITSNTCARGVSEPELYPITRHFSWGFSTGQYVDETAVGGPLLRHRRSFRTHTAFSCARPMSRTTKIRSFKACMLRFGG